MVCPCARLQGRFRRDSAPTLNRLKTQVIPLPAYGIVPSRMDNPSLPHSLFLQTRRPIRRVALACLQCRSRKVKCDATQPFCKRCQVDGKQCEYQKSRRGGRPRRSAPISLQIAVEDRPSSSASPSQWAQAFSTTNESHSSSGTTSAGSSTQNTSDTPKLLYNLEASKWHGIYLMNI